MLGPGFTIPVVFAPSHFIITVRSLRWPADIPKSPYQVPVKGCPSWAKADAVKRSTAASRKNERTDFIKIPTLRYKKFRVVDFGLASKHEFRAMVIILANVLERIGVGAPTHREHLSRPRRCVRAR